jgi:serine/threonine protein kinase/outer membrane protein assembly factor BamB
MSHQLPPPSDPQNSSTANLNDATCDYVNDGTTEELVRILDQYLADLKAGKQPNRQALLAQHASLASQLEACLAGLEFIHGTADALAESPQRLGDYQILREVGRGGMGAVFEAEQLSLGRRVALKILRFGGVSDPEALERFQREAETVAKLHHTNIVPIFAVGSEHGVNFYAMQFIDGQSLAEVLSASRSGLPPLSVAEIGLQAAEALAHAHQRGVVHRDVKPSNLLLDHENRVWLTDFGLARRLDDVTLSLTGALLGTPRYMSPEQATATTKRVDHRSDLFSLGATLYELLVGRPAFSGENPHDVIHHILCDEPLALRSIDPTIPRDLETIVMKCLAKVPQHRYASALDLADDLRAFLDARPIRARRVTPIERVWRWAKQNRRSAVLTTSAAAITVLLTLLGGLGRAQYNAWQQATVRLTAVRPPIVAETFDHNGELLRIDTLPMQSPVAITADTYQVRFSAEGKLSQDYSLALERGSNFQANITLDNGYLFPPQSVQRTYDIVDLGTESALLLWQDNHVALRKAYGPNFEWKQEINSNLEPLQVSPGFAWPWSSPTVQYSGFGSYRYQPWVVQTFIDVNKDGVGDVIAAARHQSWLLAFSGSDGKLLWFAPRGEQLNQPQGTSGLVQNYRSAVASEPLMVGDLDGDDVSELIVTFIDATSPRAIQGNLVASNRWVEAISGATGQTVWKYAIQDGLFAVQQAQEVPYDLRWFTGNTGGMSSGGRSTMALGRHISRGRGHQERTGLHVYSPTPVVLTNHAGQDKLACIAGTHLILLDPQSGLESEAPIDLEIRPGSAPQWADVDGDGLNEAVIIEPIPTTAYPGIPKVRLHVWSLSRLEVLWSMELDADWPSQPSWTTESPRWPQVVDIQADGKHEILVCHGSSHNRNPTNPNFLETTPWGEIVLLEGSTGQSLWKQRLVSIDKQIDSFIVGPDLDGDGAREIFTATFAGLSFDVYIDAISGADGKIVWSNSFEQRNVNGMNAEFVMGPLQWWNQGPDGWPQLLVHVRNDRGSDSQSLICAFSAGTGQVTHYGYGLSSAHPHDLDRDGLEELLTFNSSTSTRLDFGGELSCIRGVGRRQFMQLGELGDAIADVDGDGIDDFLRSLGDGTLLAASGATGSLLWRNRPIPAVDTLKMIAAFQGDMSNQYHSAAPEPADLDGDGIGDLFAIEETSGGRGLVSPFHAISGKTGKLIWTMSQVNARITHSLAITCDDLDGDGSFEVAWLAALDHNYPNRFAFASNDTQLWLFVASGKSGAVLWSQPLSPAFGHTMGNNSPYQFQRVDLVLACGDLNQDGRRDLLTPAIDDFGRIELRALHGKTGDLLWSRTRNPDGLSQESLRNWTPPTICDLNGDGNVEVACVEPSPQMNNGGINQQQVQVVLLQGSSGHEVWTHNTAANFTHFRSFGESEGKLLRPFSLRSDSQKSRVGMLLPGGEFNLVLFDFNGKFAERTIKSPPRSAAIWICEDSSVAASRMAFIENGILKLIAADQLDRVIWERDLGAMSQPSILAMHSSPLTNGIEIVVAKGATDNSVFGIEAATGAIRWSCPGPITRDLDDGVYYTPHQISFLRNSSNQPPLVAYSTDQLSECRQAVFRQTFGGPMGELSSAPPSFSRLPARIQTAHKDQRWLRNLPWAAEFSSSPRRIINFVLGGLFFASTLVVIPVVTVIFLLWHRQFGLRSMLVLPLVAGLVLSAALVTGPSDNDFRGVTNRLLTGLAFSPPVVAIGLWLYQVITRRKWQAMFWVIAVMVLSSVWGGIQLWIWLANTPLLPQESIDWSGWHHIIALGFYITSWIMVVVYGCLGLGQRIWTLRNSVRPTPTF